MQDEARLILVAGALLAAGIVASLFARRVRVPALVIFLLVGMAIGSDGLNWIYFDNYKLARDIGVIALALILFEGGLDAGIAEIRTVLRPAVSLALVGTIITAAVTGLAAALLFNFSTLEGLLLGSILAATDGAAVFAVLRGSTLRRRLARTLEGEAGLNDPVAILLVLGFIDWITEPGYGAVDMLGLLVVKLVVGTAIGLLVGRLGVLAFQRVQLVSAGLYPVASMSLLAISFGAAEVLGGSGFQAAYLSGLVLGSAAIPARQTLAAFHDGLAWIAQVAMFFALGLLVFPSALGKVLLESTALAAVLMLVARPLATMVATAFDRFTIRERVVLGWSGLRGAVPVVMATFPVIDGVSGSQEFFNIVFFAVLLSALVQGSTVEPLARALGVTTDRPALPKPLAETGTIRGLGAEVIEYPVSEDAAIVGRRVRELGLPREALLNVIVRGGRAIPPRGSTVIEAGDRLHVLVRQEVADVFPALFERWETGPLGLHDPAGRTEPY